jgi:hypothetical protein
MISLGTPAQSVVLIVSLFRESEQEIDINVQVQPPTSQTSLPSNLQLMVLNEEGEAVMDVQAGSGNTTIQLEFSGEPEDCFSVKVALNDVSVIEDFVI